MPNRDGNPQSLVPQRGNAHNAPHGAYSPRLREGRAREVADQVLAAPHTVPLDEYGALEIGRLIALIQALDVALTQRGVTASQGRVRDLVDVRLREQAGGGVAGQVRHDAQGARRVGAAAGGGG